MNGSPPPELDRPFPTIAVWQRYVGIGPIEEARQKLVRMIQRGESLGVVMGPPGTGKTLLCHKLAASFRQSHVVVVLGDIRVTSRLGLIQQVLFHLGQPHQGQDEDSLHLGLVQTLTKSSGNLRPLLLIIDEAQMLSQELLDEVRMLTNLIRQGTPVVQTLLAGGPRLEDSLALPESESLVQRIAARCYLHPLTHGESAQYIRAALANSSWLVDDDAIASVHHASGGIPRLINQLMDAAVEIAAQQQTDNVTDRCVQAAWAELQQLPSPVLDAELRPQASEIEFGELDADTFGSFDFENESTPRETSSQLPTDDRSLADHVAKVTLPTNGQPADGHYADVAAILNSATIDCIAPEPWSPAMPTSGDNGETEFTEASYTEASYSDATPLGPNYLAQWATEPAWQPPCSTPESPESLESLESPDSHDFPGSPAGPSTAQPALSLELSEDLFGDDFDDEATLPLTHPAAAAPQADPAAEEWQLYREIQQLSQIARSAMYGDSSNDPSDGNGHPGMTPEAADSPASIPLSTARQIHQPQSPVAERHDRQPPPSAPPMPSVNPLASAWDADPSPHAADAMPDDERPVPHDDRDLLVVEEDVSLLIDPPNAVPATLGGPRPAATTIVQNYQDLFSRLRGQQ